MCTELPRVFQRLREIGAPIVQYKVCSTFDSSPHTGSIGRALEIGREIFGNPCVPVVPAAPLLGRYVVFGNLFARDGAGIHRIDRHPAMSHHPITPMGEGDLMVHLGRQTARRLALVNVVELRGGSAEWPTNVEAVVFDGLEPGDMTETARWIWDRRETRQSFVVGSSGFTYGLLDYWRSRGWLPEPGLRSGGPARNDGRLLVLAGSCAPATYAQVRTALGSGFHGVRLNPLDWNPAVTEAEAVAQLAAGRSVILYSALGKQDRVEIDDPPAFGAALGQLLRRVILASGVARVVVAGGDTSSHAARELGITALTFSASLVRGAPLCRAHGWPGNLELVLKGGQIGPETFFVDVRAWA
ncbi:Type III effector [Candidatus Sulfopaludibacter sp. SbA3]|nr:Type III effector [Candidatus Sulfopaludibacter sp. SbA3]